MTAQACQAQAQAQAHSLKIPKNEEKRNMRFFRKKYMRIYSKNKVCEKNSMRM
jgi:hypothetical protein